MESVLRSILVLRCHHFCKKQIDRLMQFKLIAFLLLIQFAISLPYIDQITLANSLIVGRDDNADLFDWTCKVCNLENRPVHAHVIEEKSVDIKCIISVYQDFIVLAFRYTNTALNVWEDVLYPIQVVDEYACSNCKVQRAYKNMWNKIKQDVYHDLREFRHITGIDRLHITGISLGGGLATISFIDINHQEIFSSIDVTTYGAPRVGNKHWAAYFDLITLERTRRYVVDGDPIAVMPRCLTLICTYRQTGIKIVCYEDDQVCKQEHEIPDDDDEDIESRRGMRNIGWMGKHSNGYMRKTMKSQEPGSIVDHIQGYPKIYDFTLQVL